MQLHRCTLLCPSKPCRHALGCVCKNEASAVVALNGGKQRRLPAQESEHIQPAEMLLWCADIMKATVLYVLQDHIDQVAKPQVCAFRRGIPNVSKRVLSAKSRAAPSGMPMAVSQMALKNQRRVRNEKAENETERTSLSSRSMLNYILAAHLPNVRCLINTSYRIFN